MVDVDVGWRYAIQEQDHQDAQNDPEGFSIGWVEGLTSITWSARGQGLQHEDAEEYGNRKADEEHDGEDRVQFFFF